MKNKRLIGFILGILVAVVIAVAPLEGGRAKVSSRSRSH